MLNYVVKKSYELQKNILNTFKMYLTLAEVHKVLSVPE